MNLPNWNLLKKDIQNDIKSQGFAIIYGMLSMQPYIAISVSIVNMNFMLTELLPIAQITL